MLQAQGCYLSLLRSIPPPSGLCSDDTLSATPSLLPLSKYAPHHHSSPLSWIYFPHIPYYHLMYLYFTYLFEIYFLSLHSGA